MQALLHNKKEGSANIFKSLEANFSELVKKQNDINKEFKKHQNEGTHMNGFNPNNNIDWIVTSLNDITQTRYFNGRTWYSAQNAVETVDGWLPILMIRTDLWVVPINMTEDLFTIKD
jgi:hypothetical protein